MREILFRAKTEPNCKDVMNGKIIKNPKWIYGYVDLGYMHDCKAPLISDKNGNKTYKCQYETIGQFTGLTDKNGKKIFEGDILQYSIEEDQAVFVGAVKFGEFNPDGGALLNTNVGFYVELVDQEGKRTYMRKDIGFWVKFRGVEVIGNIHDNPELLETPKEAMYE